MRGPKFLLASILLALWMDSPFWLRLHHNCIGNGFHELIYPRNTNKQKIKKTWNRLDIYKLNAMKEFIRVKTEE
jgi:hypothetical protein